MEAAQQETDNRRPRQSSFGFPQQVASLQEITDNFSRSCSSRTATRSAPAARIYFTSGTQDGTPIDR